MKILILASRPLEHSGITKIEMDVIDYLGNAANVIVACPFGFENDYGKRLKEKGIECINLPPKKTTIRYMKAIASLIKEKGIDEVYINGNSAMLVFEALPAKMAGAFVVTHCHNTKSDYPIVNRMAKPLFNILTDRKIGVSKAASEWAYFGKNVITIPNGVDVNRFHVDLKVRKRIRHSLSCDNRHVFGHIGAFNKQKNHSRLISIFSEIKKMDNEAVLLLIGDGELREEIKSLVNKKELSDSVIFIDFTDKPEDYCQAIDVVIMPSLHEGLCLVALESQACGVSVLVSDVFAEETFVTKNCEKLSLNNDDRTWAEKAIAMLSNERTDAAGAFTEKRMDHDSMMRSITEVLLQKGEADKRVKDKG